MITARGEERFENVGVVVGSPSPHMFRCLVLEKVQTGDYVQVEHEDAGWVLCRVDLIRDESSIADMDSDALASGDPIRVKERIVAEVSIIGYRDRRGLLVQPRTPVRTGSFVHRASGRTIMTVLGLSERREKSAYIGRLSGHEGVAVRIDINTMVQKHVSILAKTGGGKSYLTGVLIEELMKHEVTCVIVDPHGEYGTLAHPARKTSRMDAFGIEPVDYDGRVKMFATDQEVNPGTIPLRFSITNMSAREMIALTGSKKVKRGVAPLTKVLNTLHGRPYTLDDVIRIFELDEETAKLPILQDLYYLREMGILTEKGTPISDLVEKGMTTVINLRGTPPDIQEVVVNRLASSLFELRKRGRIPPLLLVVEEAHNFAPQQGEAVCSKVMRTLASEGRKFGLGLVVVSQRAAKVDKNVLSQCNTQFILKITNPNDLSTIEKSLEGVTRGMVEVIPSLPVGVAIVSSPDLSVPVFVEVRPRETAHGGESVRVV